MSGYGNKWKAQQYANPSPTTPQRVKWKGVGLDGRSASSQGRRGGFNFAESRRAISDRPGRRSFATPRRSNSVSRLVLSQPVRNHLRVARDSPSRSILRSRWRPCNSKSKDARIMRVLGGSYSGEGKITLGGAVIVETPFPPRPLPGSIDLGKGFDLRGRDRDS